MRFSLNTIEQKCYDAVMPVDQIVALLIVERDRLNSAIEILQGPIKRPGRPVGSGRKRPARTSEDHAVANVATTPVAQPRRRKRKLSAAGRKAIGDAARKRWAAIKAGKAASPFAKSAKVKKAAKA
jgi:hypothetical protein